MRHSDPSLSGFSLGVRPLTMPCAPARRYWDYTQDAATYGGGGDWRDEVELFQDEWFGEASPGNTDHQIRSGRFAYLPIAR